MKTASFYVPGLCDIATRCFSLGVLIGCLFLLTGCYEERVVSNSWNQFKSDQNAPENTAARSSADANCAILLATMQGPFRQRESRDLIARLWSEQHIPDLWSTEAKGVLYVYRGRYVDDNNQAVQQDLRQTRMILLDGQRPFASASVVDIRTGKTMAATVTGPLDLHRFIGKYTLQIGYYDDEFPDFRGAAEKAVAVLRSEGTQAFYYHTNFRSLITVGIFEESDLGVQNGGFVYGPRIVELQKKFPNNLGNGRTLVEKVNGKAVRDQPSFIVKVE